MTLNRAPDAQAGPAPIIIDGGSDDGDGEDDGDVNLELDGSRSTDPDNEANNDITCEAISLTFSDEDLDYEWYRGHDVDPSDQDPIATGKSPSLPAQSIGMHNFTLVVTDKCGVTDTDIVRAMAVNSTHVTEQTWDFENGTPPAVSTDGLWRVTSECDVASDGNYLAFNRPTECDYETNDTLEGNATFSYDLGEWFVVGLEFETLWDTRDAHIEALQDHMSVQASLDHGSSWTPANLTFNISQGDYEENDTWVRGATVLDLNHSQYKSGNVSIRFTFDTNSSVDVENLGWLVDNVRLVGLTDNVYPAEWGNETYQEIGDPIARAQLTDEDGDGLAELDPVNHSFTGPVVEDPNITDQEVLDAMDSLNITDEDIKEDINATLANNSSYDDDREAAFDAIDNNNYNHANDELSDTEADIDYYCDPTGTEPAARDWFVGAPVEMQCDSDTENDIRLDTRVGGTSQGTCGLDSVAMFVSKDGIDQDSDEDSKRVLWGLKYQGAGGFADGDREDNNVDGEFTIEGMCGDTVTGEIDVHSGLATEPGDRLALFQGHPRGDSGNTIEGVLDQQQDDYRLEYKARESGDNDIDLRFKIPEREDRQGLQRVEFKLGLTNGRTVPGEFCVEHRDGSADCDEYPEFLKWVEFGYTQVDKREGGIAHEARFSLQDLGIRLQDLRWRWSVTENDDPQLTTDLFGLPTKTWVRLDAGTDNDPNGVASLDITKKHGKYHFGAINLDAEISSSDDEENIAINGRGDELNRYRFVAGSRADIGEGGSFIELTANLPFFQSQAFAEGDQSFFTSFDAWVDHEEVGDIDRYTATADAGPRFPQVDDSFDDGVISRADWPGTDFDQYFLDTILSSSGDTLSGLEYDEIADTGDFPCKVTVDGVCA